MSDPIQNDINQASGTPSSPDVNNAAPPANALPTNTRPNNMPVPRPQAPQAPAKPQSQSNPNQQPINPNQTAALTPTQAQPAPVHKSLFDRIFTGLGGGPRYVTKPDPNDPTKAVTTEVPTSRGDITKSLLAGVIHGIIAGGAAGANAPADKYTDADGRVHEVPSRVNSNMAALGAGFNAGKQNQQQFKNAPQQAYDIQQQRQATVLSNNVNELRNQMMADKLHDEDWSMKENYYAKTQDIYKPIIDNITQASQDSGTQLVAASGLGHADAMKQVQANPSGLSAVQDGWTTETHGDGRTYHVPTFSLVKIGDVPVSRDALSALAPYNSAVQKLLDSTSGNSTLSTSMLLSLEKQATAANGAHTFLNQLQDGMGVPQMSQADFNAKLRSSPQLQRNVNDIATVLGSVGTQSSAHALAQLQQSGKANEFFKLLGKNPDQITDYINKKQNEEIAATKEASMAGNLDKLAPTSDDKKDAAISINSLKHLPKDITQSYMSQIGRAGTRADLEKIQNKATADEERFQQYADKAAATAAGKAGYGDDQSSGTAYLATLPPNVAATVKAIGEGRSTLGALPRGKEKTMYVDAINRAYPGYDESKALAYQKVRNDFTSGQTSKGIGAINTALNHLDQVNANLSATSTLPGISGINAAFGGHAAAEESSVAAVQDEIAKAYKAGVISDTESRKFAGLLTAYSPAKRRENVKELAVLLNGKFDSLRNQWNNGLPAGVTTPITLVTPQAAAAYERITGEKLQDTGTQATQQTQQPTQQTQQPTQAQSAAPVFTKFSGDGKWGWNGQQWVARKAQ